MVKAILVAMLLTTTVSAQVVIRDSRLREAEQLYQAEAYDKAIALLSVPELFAAIPVMDRLGPEKRAGLLFDVARMHYASGDDGKAKETLKFLFGLAPLASSGLLELPDDAHLTSVLDRMAVLRVQAENDLYASRGTTMTLFRNAVLPGWGQIYRGRKQRGRIYAAAALVTGAAWAVTYSQYKSELDTYNSLSQADLTRDPAAFRDQFDVVESKSNRSNLMMGLFLGVWATSAIDNVVVGPRSAAVVIPIGN
jgi:hypothetical protein